MFSLAKIHLDRKHVATPAGTLSLGPMIVGVQPLAGFDKVLHYKVPESLRMDVQLGSLVRVPIMNQHKVGLVLEVNAIADVPVERLKNLTSVMQDYPALTPDLLELAKWMHGYYAARMEAVLEAMIPAAVRDGTRVKQEKYLAVARPAPAEELAALRKKAPQQAKVFEFLQQQFQPVKKSLVLARLGATADRKSTRLNSSHVLRSRMPSSA